MSVILVDPAVTNQKFRQELDLWKEHSDHQHRGWLLLDENDSVPSVEVAFLAGVATSVGAGFLPIIVCTIRLTYENYDLWPPSLTFIDVFTRQPSRPHARAFLSTPRVPVTCLLMASDYQPTVYVFTRNS